MQAALVRLTFRGVLCRHCGHPSRVGPSIVSRECSFKQSAPNFTNQWCSQMFFIDAEPVAAKPSIPNDALENPLR
jgi:hypothetical protein